jgi:hypothetical protein
MSKTLVTNGAASPTAVSNAARVEALIAAESLDVMRLLSGAVPLSLLIDLVLPTPSVEILAREGGDAGWFTDVA